MKHRPILARARNPFAAMLLSLPLLLVGCSTATPPTSSAPNTAEGFGHIHGMSVDPTTTKILLATHDGLYDTTANAPVKVSETTIDLMGFTAAAEPGTFYASGHPGPGSSLPNPVGLIQSTDSGKTWQAVSRAGQSDFHTLTISGEALVGFDGQLRTSTDGITWTTSATTFTPTVLAGSPASTVVLATTQDGLQRSTDSGTTWQSVPKSPNIQFVAIATPREKAPTNAVGVATDGSVFLSTDTGLTWAATGTVTGQIEAITAVEGSTGKPTIWVSTPTGVQVSTDSGKTFRPVSS
ncbi:F510_1955 family glycosylhydrolase [Arthrobacter sp. Sr24]